MDKGYIVYHHFMAGVRMIEELKGTEFRQIYMMDSITGRELKHYDSSQGATDTAFLLQMMQAHGIVYLLEVLLVSSSLQTWFLSWQHCVKQPHTIAPCHWQDAEKFLEHIKASPLLFKLFQAYVICEGIDMAALVQGHHVNRGFRYASPRANL